MATISELIKKTPNVDVAVRNVRGGITYVVPAENDEDCDFGPLAGMGNVISRDVFADGWFQVNEYVDLGDILSELIPGAVYQAVTGQGLVEVQPDGGVRVSASALGGSTPLARRFSRIC